ncbi:hypothetical protein J6590_002198 [Homalodisca vitripennis]|nr:hypothetical protein J6590_002198 [Homalodisca vitripennis]
MGHCCCRPAGARFIIACGEITHSTLHERCGVSGVELLVTICKTRKTANGEPGVWTASIAISGKVSPCHLSPLSPPGLIPVSPAAAHCCRFIRSSALLYSPSALFSCRHCFRSYQFSHFNTFVSAMTNKQSFAPVFCSCRPVAV